MISIENIIQELEDNKNISNNELYQLLSNDEANKSLYEHADKVRKLNYGTDVYIRGLIESSNISSSSS